VRHCAAGCAQRGAMRHVWRCVRRTLHLDTGIRRRAQQHELPAALQGAPGRVLDEVRALLVRQPRDHLQCGVTLCNGGSMQCNAVHATRQVRLQLRCPAARAHEDHWGGFSAYQTESSQPGLAVTDGTCSCAVNVAHYMQQHYRQQGTARTAAMGRSASDSPKRRRISALAAALPSATSAGP
jgi:hypothetical protein